MAKLPAQDIVERLREPEFVTTDTGRLAADNEALRKERDGWKSQCLKAEFDHGELGRLTDKYKARADALAQQVERLRALLIRASVSLESFAEIGSMLSLAGATEADEVEVSGDQLRPALIAAKTVKVEIDAALGDRP